MQRPALLVFSAIVLTLAAGCSRPVDTQSAGAGPASAGAPAQAPSKLGDLSPFRSLAVDVAAMVEKGDLAAAKVRIKDLELSWDAAEAGLKPRAAGDWHRLDKSIDKALSALRASQPTQAESSKAMSELLQTLDALQGKA